MKYWAVLFFLFISLSVYAQDNSRSEGDSSEGGSSINSNTNRFFESRGFEVLHVGIPLIAAGLAIQPASDEFKQLRDSYCLNTQIHVDDYLQYAPAALMIGLKTAGIESRSSWGRMLTSDAISVAVMALATNSLKSVTNVHRPDSGADNSFPSGHTATAFMTATMLHKEYGAVSKWYSIGGYTAATATGLMRVVNNRHWISDVMAGAGVGIISTQLGYMLADMIWGDKGINKDLDQYERADWYNIDAPSSLGLYLGVATSLGKITGESGESAKISMGSKVGIEGAYALNRRWGIGGRITLANSSVEVDNVEIYDELDTFSSSAGGYFTHPISPRWRIGAKALAGINYYGDCNMSESLQIEKGVRAALGAGASIEYLSNRGFAMKLFCDYDSSYLSDLPNNKALRSTTFGLVNNIIF